MTRHPGPNDPLGTSRPRERGSASSAAGDETLPLDREALSSEPHAQATYVIAREGGPAAASGDPDAIARVGRYAVLGRLGRGGMGEVLRVRDPDLGREMAAKVMLEHPDARQLEKFLLEARITGQLEHPAIVPIHELGRTADGRAYFTMKRVQGEDLARVLDRLTADPHAGPGLDERVAIFAKVCEALAFAHAQGVIHRDLKPANVMVGAFGEVQVMDWGLAKVLAAPALPADPGAEGAPESGVDSAVGSFATQDGTILGTPAYMPPEQADGRVADLDARSDVYALGAMLYHVLALVPPYEGETLWEVLGQVAAGDLVAPHLRAPDLSIPWELSAVVVQAMAMDPGARYPTVAALLADVHAWQRGGVLSAARYTVAQLMGKWIRRHRTVGLVAVVLALASAGWSSYAGWQRQAERRAFVDGALAEARALLERHPYAAVAPTMAGVGDALIASGTPVTLARAAERDQAIAARIQAASALDRALARSPDEPAVVALHARVDHELGRLALDGGDYSLAVQAFRDLARFGLDPGELQALLFAVDSARNARQSYVTARLAAIIEDVSAGLKRSGRAPTGPDLDDHVFEAASYREFATVRLVGAALEPLIERARAQGPTIAWSAADKDLARFASRVLSRLRLTEPTDVLVRWMEVVWDPDLAIEAGRALLRLPGTGGHAAVRAASERLGLRSPYSEDLLPRLAVIDAAPPAEPRDDATPTDVAWTVGVFLMERRPAEALRHLERAIAREPTWEAALLLMRAVTLVDLEDWDGARRDFDAALEREPESAPAYRGRGNLKKRRGDFDGAIHDLRRALRIEPHPAAHRDLAEVYYFQLEDLEAASREVELALGFDPRDAEILSLRGSVLAAKGQLQDALADLDRAVEIAPRNARYLAVRGSVRQSAGDLARGFQDLNDSLEIDPDNFFGLANRALALTRAGELDGALADAQRAVAVAPQYPAAFHTLALVHAQRDELDAALAAVDRALVLWPHHIKARVLRAQVREQLGDFNGAVADWDLVTARAPRDPLPFRTRARLYRVGSDYARALAEHARALELTRGAPRLELLLERCLTNVEHRAFAEAGADVNAILTEAPESASASAARALIAAAQGRTVEARDAFVGVALRDPGGAYWPLWAAALGAPRSVLDAVAARAEWPSPVARVLRGDLGMEGAVAALERLSPQVRRRRRCELEAFTGLVHEGAGRTAEARTAYRLAVAQGMADSWQYSWAVCRRAALGR